jgi:chemotaxis protein CheC
VGDTDFPNQLGFSALRETGNILTGSYLSSLADFTGLNLQPMPPALTIDMAGAVLASGLTEASRFGDYALLIETHFTEWEEIKGRFLFVPDPDSFAEIFHALGVPFHDG